MKRISRSTLPAIALAIGAAGLVLSCQQQPGEQAGAAEEAVVDTEGANAANDATLRAWEAAVKAADPAGLAGHYADDAVLMPEDLPRAQGRADIEDRLEQIFANAPPAELTLSTDDLVVAESGDIAYAYGTVLQTGPAGEGEEYEYRGKWLVVLENVDGEWKVAADIWNADANLAAAGAAGAAEPAASNEES